MKRCNELWKMEIVDEKKPCTAIINILILAIFADKIKKSRID